jgi:hypothetical protein
MVNDGYLLLINVNYGWLCLIFVNSGWLVRKSMFFSCKHPTTNGTLVFTNKQWSRLGFTHGDAWICSNGIRYLKMVGEPALGDSQQHHLL